jgi:putative mRNA 3-end processing factor
MLTVTENGLYCAAGEFYIDPWRSVSRALITHAHSDHARQGSSSYLCAEACVGVLQQRLGESASIQGVAYGEELNLNGVRISFHPAGHVLGSAQIRVEHAGQVWVASGDYKRQADPTCTAFEPVRCHTFITESTFGLPVYRWEDPAKVNAEVNEWWSENQGQQRTSILFAYSLGKAQRLLAGLEPELGPILVHKAILDLLPAYAAQGVTLPVVMQATKESIKSAQGRAMVLLPPSLDGSPWMNGLGDVSTAVASGWMQIRGNRRRRSVDRGFVLSDHADWSALLQTIRDTGAERVLVTHGATGPLVRWLNENGWSADPLRTQFGEGEEKEE